MGGRSQGVLRNHSHSEDRHNWQEKEEGDMRGSTCPTRERHLEALEELHFRRHCFSALQLLLN